MHNIIWVGFWYLSSTLKDSVQVNEIYNSNGGWQNDHIAHKQIINGKVKIGSFACCFKHNTSEEKNKKMCKALIFLSDKIHALVKFMVYAHY